MSQHDTTVIDFNPNRHNQAPLNEEQLAKLKKFLENQTNQANQAVKQFPSGATRTADEGKIDYEGFLSFPVLELYGTYMTKHRVQVDGTLRSSSNWKRGLPLVGEGSYLKAFTRHTFEFIALITGYTPARIARELPALSHRERIFEAGCAVLFNLQGFLHEALRDEKFGTETLR